MDKTSIAFHKFAATPNEGEKRNEAGRTFARCFLEQAAPAPVNFPFTLLAKPRVLIYNSGLIQL
jgi:hypothetical protein